MSPDKEEKIIKDIQSVATSLIENAQAGSRLAQFGKAILLLAELSTDPAARDRAVEELEKLKTYSESGVEMEKLLKDLGIRLN